MKFPLLVLSSLLLVQEHVVVITAFTVSSSRSKCSRSTFVLNANAPNPMPWNGEVVSNSDENDNIMGCSIVNTNPDALVDWVVTIDGMEADLGKFSEVIYRKFMMDARQQSFQGFRPGTVPPHLEPTYRAYAMDECARETLLEALQQNNIKPFDSTRQEATFSNICIPPPPVKKPKKKKKKKVKKKKGKKNNDPTAEEAAKAEAENAEPKEPEKEEPIYYGTVPVVAEPEPEPEPVPQWLVFDDVEAAIAGGWKPGQSFSFVANNVRGQKYKSDEGNVVVNSIGGGGRFLFNN